MKIQKFSPCFALVELLGLVLGRALPRWSVAVGALIIFVPNAAFSQFAQAPVEARVPAAPRLVLGTDEMAHLAYELHITNFYQSTGTLHLRRVAVFANDATLPLANFTAVQVNGLLAHPADSADTTAGVPIEAGKRVVLFLWLKLPAGVPGPEVLRHRLEFESGTGAHQLVEGVLTRVKTAQPIVLSAPLRAGAWLVHEGPGNHRSHHWGSLVAVNGRVTIPQRYAIDFFGLDATTHAVRTARDKISDSASGDWVGFGAEVLAVANGIVRDMRDGEPNNKPLAALTPPANLTSRTLLGNFIALEIAPNVFASYAHLQPGSLTVKVGDRVRRGAVLGRLGQSGNSNAPHLHFQVATAATFEESEGLPFTFKAFTRLGTASIGDILDQATKILLDAGPKPLHRRQLPLDGDIINFK